MLVALKLFWSRLSRINIVYVVMMLALIAFVILSSWYANRSDFQRAAAMEKFKAAQTTQQQTQQAANVAEEQLRRSHIEFAATTRRYEEQIAKLTEELRVAQARVSKPYAPRRIIAPARDDLVAATDSARRLYIETQAPSVRLVLGDTMTFVEPVARLVEARALVTMTATEADVLTEIVGERLPALISTLVTTRNLAQATKEQNEKFATRLDVLTTAHAAVLTHSRALEDERDAATTLAKAMEPPFVLFDARFWMGAGVGAVVVTAVVTALVVSAQ